MHGANKMFTRATQITQAGCDEQKKLKAEWDVFPLEGDNSHGTIGFFGMQTIAIRSYAFQCLKSLSIWGDEILLVKTKS